MKIVRQRGSSDCGVAAAAMVSGVGYRAAAAVAPAAHARLGIDEDQMRSMLRILTRRTWSVMIPRPFRPLTVRLSWPKGPAVAIVRREGHEVSHYVVLDGGLVYDPEHVRARSVRAYPRRHWHLIRLILPAAV
jgi:hypothetical protein